MTGLVGLPEPGSEDPIMTQWSCNNSTSVQNPKIVCVLALDNS